jgi:hypothetical protein
VSRLSGTEGRAEVLISITRKARRREPFQARAFRFHIPPKVFQWHQALRKTPPRKFNEANASAIWNLEMTSSERFGKPDYPIDMKDNWLEKSEISRVNLNLPGRNSKHSSLKKTTGVGSLVPTPVGPLGGNGAIPYGSEHATNRPCRHSAIT